MATKTVTTNASNPTKIGFRVGTQAAVDTLIGKGTTAGALEGTFYLAGDTHRLYIGNNDGSISAVNEGVITVANVAALTSLTGNSYIGNFYYATSENILCVYNGQQWVQINQDTDIHINSNDFTSWEVATDQVGLADTIQDNDGNSFVSRFSIKGTDGIKITQASGTVTVQGQNYTVPVITVAGDKYTLSTAAVTGGVDVKLDSTNTTNDSKITLKSGDNVTISRDTSNNVTIKAEDTKNAALNITAQTSSPGGFQVSVTDSKGDTVSDTIDPQIVIGGNTQSEVHFLNGKATLSVYTKAETDSLLTALNAMTYRGTLGPSGTAATSVGVSNGTITVYNGANTVNDIAIGDTFLVTTSSNINYTDPITHNEVSITPHSLLIARSSDGTETNGVIPANKLTFDVVSSTSDTDTTYSVSTTTNGIRLMDMQGDTHGGLEIVKGSITGTGANITITPTEADDSNGGKIKTFTIKHDTVTRSNTTGTAKSNYTGVSTGDFVGSSITVPVITSVTSDATGHVTGVQTTNYTIYDTQMSYANTTTTSAHTRGGFNTGVIKQSLVGTNAAGDTAPANDSYILLNSSTLSITDKDDGYTAATGGSAKQGLAIEMVWGSF